MAPSKGKRNRAKRQSSSDISLTQEKKARIDAEENKIIDADESKIIDAEASKIAAEISDLPDLELGIKLVDLVNLKIWRNVFEEKNSLEAEILLQKQKIEELEFKVNTF